MFQIEEFVGMCYRYGLIAHGNYFTALGSWLKLHNSFGICFLVAFSCLYDPNAVIYNLEM